MEERKSHVEALLVSGAPADEQLDIDGRWSDHEVLPVLGEPNSPMLLGAGVVRILVQFAVIVIVLRSALSAWRASSNLHDTVKKDDDSAFSMRV